MTSAMIVITMSISISVMPRCARPLLVVPTDDVGINPFSAGLAIRARRNDVGLVAVIAGKFVEIRVVPGIVRCVLRQVGSGPLIHVLGFHAQCVETHFGVREISGV